MVIYLCKILNGMTLSSLIPRTWFSKYEKSWMFKESLTPRYYDLVLVYMRYTLQEVVDTTIIVGRNFFVIQRGVQI